jgi:hypothetical protein
MLGLIVAPGRNGESFVASADPAQHVGVIDDLVGDEMHYAARRLDLAAAGHHL